MTARIEGMGSENELLLVKVGKGEDAGLQWLDEHEFRYRGHAYDLVHHYATADTHYYVCINDKEEDRLFRNLELYVAAQCDAEEGSGEASGPLNGISREYVPEIHDLEAVESRMTRMALTHSFPLIGNSQDVPTPPPRSA